MKARRIDNLKVYKNTWASERRKNFKCGFELPYYNTEELFSEMKSIAGIGGLQQQPEQILAWIKKLPQVFQDEIMIRGYVVCLQRTKVRAQRGLKGQEARNKQNAILLKNQIEKSKQFDRIVEMLDHEMVGDKLLGDCTKADLLRAAVGAEQKAGEMTLQAAFYRLLADLVPHDQTVRQSNKRGDIVALLTHNFKEET